MLTLFFCLECEDNFSVLESPEDCPFCGSKNFMEDSLPSKTNWDDDGHFEGDMPQRAVLDNRGDD